MPLTDEQRSMLQLLLQGQSYDDIGSLLGVGRDEVRSRARAALQEMGGADPDARVGLSDFLLGQADPIGRADAVRHLQNDPEANALAERLVAQLRLLAPGAELPEIPPARGGRVPPAEPPTAQQPGVPSRISGAFGGGGGSDNQARLLVGIGAAALLIIAVVLVVVLGGDDDGGDGGQADTGTATTAAQGSENLTIVQLAPISGSSDASGQAVFATVQNQPVLQLNLNGLQPAGEGQNYIVWLYNSARIAFPLARDQVGENGSLTGAAAIPTEVVPLLGQFGCVDVSLASNKATQAALQQAVEGETLPAHSGETVLRGQIPTAPGQQAPSGADAQCDVAAAGGAQGGGAQGGGAQGGNGGGAGNG